MLPHLPLLFLDACNLVAGRERRSKLLHPDSELYKRLKVARNALEGAFPAAISPQRMDFHMELLDPADDFDDVELLVRRASALHGTPIILHAVPMGKAITLTTRQDEPPSRHITIAHFGTGIPIGAVEVAQEALLRCEKSV